MNFQVQGGMRVNSLLCLSSTSSEVNSGGGKDARGRYFDWPGAEELGPAAG